MALDNGTKLGPYEIEAPLGSGGMGEVYKARDTRLERTVAIKVLPEHSTLNADMRTRFEREAKVISSLNHPHICTLHDIGHQDGVDYLVMEYLEGETLDRRIAKGKIASSEALEIAVQIAGALEAAHRKGLVHRDLKPGNVILTKEGAKLLDFGLAKFTAEVMPGGHDKTHTTPVTGVDAIVGTLQYMSPEQLEAKEADARSDIFAFGATLYEMLTGQRAFPGESRASLIGSIMKDEPRSISEILPTSPPALDRLIHKCIQKDPDRRWQTAGDMRDELEWIASAGSQAGVPRSVSSKRRFRFRISWLLTILLAIVAVLLGGRELLRKVTVPQLMRFQVQAPDDLDRVEWPQISPDGRYLAFQAFDSTGQSRVWVRPLNSLNAYPLAGTENAGRPFWSPDSKFLAFFGESGEVLQKVPVAGGRPQVICNTPGADGCWGPDNVIVFDKDRTVPLRKVPATGGTPHAATVIDTAASERYHSWPSFLPNGRDFIFTAYSNARADSSDKFVLKVGSIDELESKSIGISGSRAVYCEPGYVLYQRAGFVVAHKFDVSRMELIGDPVPLSDFVTTAATSSAGVNMSASNNGILALLTDNKRLSADSTSLLVWYDRQGKPLDTIGDPVTYFDLALSNDNSRLAFVRRGDNGKNNEVWVRNLRSGAMRQISPPNQTCGVPVWSPDDSSLVYYCGEGEPSEIYKYDMVGSGNPDLLYKADSINLLVTDWSIDDRLLMVNFFVQPEIVIAPVDRVGEFESIVPSKFVKFPAEFSPDGRYFLYHMIDRDGVGAYIMEIESRNRWKVWTQRDDSRGRWRNDGKEIFFLDGNDLYSVPITFDNGPKPGTPQKLFSVHRGNKFFYTYNTFAAANDGQRFLFAVPARPVDEEHGPQFEIVLNWYTQLDHE